MYPWDYDQADSDGNRWGQVIIYIFIYMGYWWDHDDGIWRGALRMHQGYRQILPTGDAVGRETQDEYPLVNIQKAIEKGHRNSEFSS